MAHRLPASCNRSSALSNSPICGCLINLLESSIMKLVTFVQSGSTRIGALVSDRVVDFSQADPSLPKDMLSFLAGGKTTLAAAQKAVAGATGIPLSSVKLLAPIPRPGKIICIGLNYSDHAAETGQAIPKFPVVFS